MDCRFCGAGNDADARFCDACGKSFAPEPKICGECGTTNRASARFCSGCGGAVNAQPAPTETAPDPTTRESAAAIPLPEPPPSEPQLPEPPLPECQPDLPPAATPASSPIDSPDPQPPGPPPPSRPPPLPPILPIATPQPAPKNWLEANKTLAICVLLLALLGLYLIFAPGGEAPETATDPDAKLVGRFAAVMAAGGAFATAVLIDSQKARLGVAAGIGFVAALLYNSVPVTPLSGSLAGDLVLAVAAACAVAAVGSLFFKYWTWVIDGPGIRKQLQLWLIPRHWPTTGTPPTIPAKDLVARWFVTIAASTGSVVGTLAAQPDFWRAAIHALSPSHILFTLLLMAVSITLIGPLEEYIFGQKLIRRSDAEPSVEHGGARSLIEDVWLNFSPRAAGRLALVFAFSLQPTLLDACVGESINRGDAQAAFVILVSAIGPAFTTYYWSAALQHGTGSIMVQAGNATTAFGAMIWYPMCVVVASLLAFSWLWSGNGHPAIVFLPIFGLVLGMAFALIFGLMLDGITGYAGGWALDRSRRHGGETWQAIATLGGALVASKVAVIFPFLLALRLFEIVPGMSWRENMLPTTLAMVGWTLGLLVSGFPTILHAARAAAGSGSTGIAVTDAGSAKA